jgi:hypothetical protein
MILYPNVPMQQPESTATVESSIVIAIGHILDTLNWRAAL